MKKPLMMGVFCFVIIAMSIFAGCITTESQRIEGTMHNNTEYLVDVYFRNKATGQNIRWGVANDSTKYVELATGAYSVSANYRYDDSLIGSADLELTSADATWYVNIYNTSVFANAY